MALKNLKVYLKELGLIEELVSPTPYNQL